MKEGPTWKRRDILLADDITKKSICCKLWGEHSEKITEEDTGSIIKISNVEVHIYNDRHQLKSTTLTALEVNIYTYLFSIIVNMNVSDSVQNTFNLFLGI